MLIPTMGVEPITTKGTDFKSAVYTNSTKWAFFFIYNYSYKSINGRNGSRTHGFWYDKPTL